MKQKPPFVALRGGLEHSLFD